MDGRNLVVLVLPFVLLFNGLANLDLKAPELIHDILHSLLGLALVLELGDQVLVIRLQRGILLLKVLKLLLQLDYFILPPFRQLLILNRHALLLLHDLLFHLLFVAIQLTRTLIMINLVHRFLLQRGPRQIKVERRDRW